MKGNDGNVMALSGLKCAGKALKKAAQDYDHRSSTFCYQDNVYWNNNVCTDTNAY